MESAAMITENLPDIIPPTVPAQTIKTDDLLDAFLSNKSEKTIIAYKRDSGAVSAIFGGGKYQRGGETILCRISWRSELYRAPV